MDIKELQAELDTRDENMRKAVDVLNAQVKKNSETLRAYSERLKLDDGIPHRLWGTQAKAEIMGNWAIVQAFKNSQWKNSPIVEEAQRRLDAAVSYGANTSEGVEWMAWEYARVITDLQNQYGLLRQTIPPFAENLVGQRGVDFPTKTGAFTGAFLSEVASGRANATTNARTIGATTVAFKAIAAYAYATRLVAGTNRVNFIDSIIADHAQAIAKVEDTTAFTASGSGGATVDGGMTGLITACDNASNTTTMDGADTLSFDDLLDMRANLSSVVREDVGNLVLAMSFATYNYLRKQKSTTGFYLLKELQDDDKPYRNVDGIRLAIGEVMPSASGETYGRILLYHNSEAYKYATGTKILQVEEYSQAPAFSIGVGAYEEFAGVVVGDDAAWCLKFDAGNLTTDTSD